MIRTLTFERLAPFRRWLPRDVHFWLKALILALVAVQLTRLLWAIVTPVGPFGDWRPAMPRQLSAEAQTALLSSIDPFYRAGAMQAAPASAALPAGLELFGTREGSGGLPGSAIIGTPEEQKSYVVGEEVAPGVKLAAVAFDHVILDRGGVRQTVYMPGADDGSATGAAPGGAPAALADAFEFRPRGEGSNVTGAIVAPGRNPAFYQSAGFRPGDVIVAVNGARISSLIDVQQLQSSIAPGARLMLSVERGGQTVPIALNLPANP